MRYRDRKDKSRSPDQHLELEREAHDIEYSYSDGTDEALKFSVNELWKINDFPYKPGTYKRGRRKRRLYELMDLEGLSGKKVLEVGCGMGRDSVFFAMHGAKSFGFDISEKGIEVAKRTAGVNGVEELCDFRVGNASAMPYDNEMFDVVVINAVLHHVLKYPNVREETFRVLKPGGKLVIAEGIRDNRLYRGVRALMRGVRGRRYLGDVDVELEDIRRFTRDYSSYHIEQFSLSEKFVEGLARYHDNGKLVRFLFRCSDVIDRGLLTAFPWLRKSCLEAVIIARK